MELISAHIINFGKLSDLELDFSRGLNTFIHENGWGKTTLTVFIKSMLYGMEYTSSKSLEKNEKLKYLPWQGGTYGGSLRFAHNGKEYLITRTFSTKKDGDTFQLRDLTTNKLSSDFTSNLGNEIFGINRETYSRSVHVILEESPEGSDDISAKLNNLIESGDVSAYDPAVEALNKNITALKGRAQKGEIYQLQNDIDLYREKINEIDAKLKQNEQLEEKISAIDGEVKGLKSQQEQVTALLSESAKYEGKLRYEQLKKDLEETERKLDNLSDFFNGQIPDDDILSKIDEISSQYTTVNSNIQTFALSQTEINQYEELKKSFAGDIPTREQIDNCLKTEREYAEFRRNESQKKLSEDEAKDYAALKARFGSSDLTADQISDKLSQLSQVQTLNNDVIRLEAEKLSAQTKLEALKQAKKKNPLILLLALFALLAAGFGAASLFLPLGKTGLIAGLALAAVFALSALFAGLAGKNKASFSEDEKALSELENKITDLKTDYQKKQTAISDFIARYSAGAGAEGTAAMAGGTEIALINHISLDFNRYSILQEKSNQYFAWLQNQPKVACDFENELKAFVSRFCKSQDISAVSNQIQILNEKVNKLQELEAKVNSDAKNKQLFSDKKEKLSQILSQYKTEKTLDFASQVQQLHNKINDIKNTSELLKTAREKVAAFENDPQNDIQGFENLQKPEENPDELHAKLTSLSESINAKNAEISNYRRIIEANLSETDRKGDILKEIDRLVAEKEEKTQRHKILTLTLDFLQKARENLDANYSDPMKEGFEKYISLLEGSAAAGEGGTGTRSGSPQKLLIDTDLKVMVDHGDKLYDSNYLSAGYKDMVNFCSRMALIDALFDKIKPPVILDDPFVNLDDEKTTKALKLVAKMAEEKQILYFACHKSRVVK